VIEEIVKGNFDESVAAFNLLAVLHANLQARTVLLDRIDPDVDQDLRAVAGT
jgi:hypothetical protein